ncbi:MAG: hypothetical protein WCP52_06540 [Bacteroidota bacterium]
MLNKFTLLGVIVFFILLTAYCIDIPFFWDGTFFSALSLHFYNNGFNGLIAPQSWDTGGFPLFSIYLTSIWKAFGKTISASHLAMLPILIAIAFEYYKLARHYLSKMYIPFAMLLLLLEPTFITQASLMGYDLFLILFFLISVNALLTRNLVIYSLSITLLCLCSVRGSFFATSIFLLHIFNERKSFNQELAAYLLPLVVMLTWIIYHHQKTGWYFFSPERENTHEAILSIRMMIRQLLFTGWKIVDFGRLILWIIIISVGFVIYKKGNLTKFKLLLSLIAFPLIVYAIFSVPFSNPIAHKYFVVIFLCLNIGICYILSQMENRAMRNTLFSICCISLLSGNFWLYPERFGNGWDSSLKIIPFFKLKNEMDEYIMKNKIPPHEIGTQFPLIADKLYTDLSDSSYHYTNVWSGPISNFNYFLQSNIINTDIPQQIDDVKEHWILLKHERNGLVYLNLYKNPKK